MNSLLYGLYLAFFISHVPITLLVDSQAGEITRHTFAVQFAERKPHRRSRVLTPAAAARFAPAVFPASWYPQPLRDLTAWYFKTYNDPLVCRWLPNASMRCLKSRLCGCPTG